MATPFLQCFLHFLPFSLFSLASSPTSPSILFHFPLLLSLHLLNPQTPKIPRIQSVGLFSFALHHRFSQRGMILPFRGYFEISEDTFGLYKWKGVGYWQVVCRGPGCHDSPLQPKIIQPPKKSIVLRLRILNKRNMETEIKKRETGKLKRV